MLCHTACSQVVHAIVSALPSPGEIQLILSDEDEEDEESQEEEEDGNQGQESSASSGSGAGGSGVGGSGSGAASHAGGGGKGRRGARRQGSVGVWGRRKAGDGEVSSGQDESEGSSGGQQLQFLTPVKTFSSSPSEARTNSSVPSPNPGPSFTPAPLPSLAGGIATAAAGGRAVTSNSSSPDTASAGGATVTASNRQWQGRGLDAAPSVTRSDGSGLAILRSGSGSAAVLRAPAALFGAETPISRLRPFPARQALEPGFGAGAAVEGVDGVDRGEGTGSSQKPPARTFGAVIVAGPRRLAEDAAATANAAAAAAAVASAHTPSAPGGGGGALSSAAGGGSGRAQGPAAVGAAAVTPPSAGAAAAAVGLAATEAAEGHIRLLAELRLGHRQLQRLRANRSLHADVAPGPTVGEGAASGEAATPPLAPRPLHTPSSVDTELTRFAGTRRQRVVGGGWTPPGTGGASVGAYSHGQPPSTLQPCVPASWDGAWGWTQQPSSATAQQAQQGLSFDATPQRPTPGQMGQQLHARDAASPLATAVTAGSAVGSAAAVRAGASPATPHNNLRPSLPPPTPHTAQSAIRPPAPPPAALAASKHLPPASSDSPAASSSASSTSRPPPPSGLRGAPPGPPPAPPPPPRGFVHVTPTREQRRRLKALHWDKISKARQGSVWSAIQVKKGGAVGGSRRAGAQAESPALGQDLKRSAGLYMVCHSGEG